MQADTVKTAIKKLTDNEVVIGSDKAVLSSIPQQV